jgi:hypothetical protein
MTSAQLSSWVPMAIQFFAVVAAALSASRAPSGTRLLAVLIVLTLGAAGVLRLQMATEGHEVTVGSVLTLAVALFVPIGGAGGLARLCLRARLARTIALVAGVGAGLALLSILPGLELRLGCLLTGVCL